MNAASGSAAYHYAGAVVLLALVLGGGSEQGLWTDHLIEAALSPAIVIGFASLFAGRIGTSGKILFFSLLAIVALQFLPFHRAWPPGADPGSIATAVFSPTPLRSVEAAAFLLALLGFGTMLARMDDARIEGLARYFLLGLVLNGAIGVVQLSYAREEALTGLLPYPVKSAVFANENHLSALVVALIPLLAWRFIGVSRAILAFLAVAALLLLLLFAVGSRAGMVLSVGMTFLSIAWYGTPSRHGFIKPLLAVATLTAIFLASFLLFGEDSLEQDARAIFFRTTLRAIGDFWLTGSGLGTFRVVYPMYENPAEIAGYFANQAHNDFLQIFLETGLAGLAILALFAGLAIIGERRNKLSQAAFLSLMALALHSVVDYPLRTFAVAILFAYFATILLVSTEPERRDSENAQAGQPSDLDRNGALSRPTRTAALGGDRR